MSTPAFDTSKNTGYAEDGTLLYLREMSRTPRLTPQQELELGERIAAGDEEALRIWSSPICGSSSALKALSE